jgi:uncharacterized protein
MFQRNVLLELTKWSKRTKRKPMVLRGARQVGKTTLVEIFSKQFSQYLYLNLEFEEDKKPFESFTSVSKLMQTLFVQKNLSYDKKEDTLIFIDEIQELPEAMNLLRYFYEQEPSIPVIAAGSLLETIFNNKVSFPVGRVEYLVVRPVSFSEFLYATSENIAAEQLHILPMNDFAFDKLLLLFNQYALIGGMPEVVSDYAENKDITALARIYNSLLISYSDDVEKYADGNAEVQQIRHVIKAAFIEAGKRIKFEGFGDSNYKSREMGEAFRTLEKALLMHLVYPNTGVSLPLLPDKKKSPRLQVLDTGLLNFSAGLQLDILGSKDLNEVHQGLIIEHLVGQELLATDFSSLHTLQFWVRDKNSSQAEVDFIVKYKNKLIPIEVKSGATGKLKSLHMYMDMAPHKMAIRFCAAKLNITKIITPMGTEYFLLTLPYFLVCKINEYLPWFEMEVEQLLNIENA